VIKSFIEVRVQQRFSHRWEKAPEHRKYLRSFHPHNFEIRLEMQVFETDREIEFHDVQDWLWQLVFDQSNMWRNDSCETMAEKIVMFARHKYGTGKIGLLREIKVEVWEDDSVGGKVKYLPIRQLTIEEQLAIVKATHALKDIPSAEVPA